MLGKTVAHYRIIDRLGGGGMGVVYKAEDLKLGRSVALKFLSPELTRDPEAKRRFEREARSASLLDHPNICTIYDFGEADDGQMFIAMPCYEGESLQQKIRGGPLPVREAIRIVEQVARGLAKAHSSGIVHRDLKPGNVMLTIDGIVKIVDFGLAKLFGASHLTTSGVVLGTVAYMAPEQIRGESVDARADIWSLGILLFELIAGKHPFRGDHPNTIIHSILNEQPSSILEFTDVPPELDVLIKRMLRKDPLQRYQSIEEVLAGLSSLVSSGSGPESRGRIPHAGRERFRSGARLGPYEISGPLGSGGMGDVYLARDMRLDRQVAIKVLAPEFSEDSQRKERFKREAKTISSLNHANICMLFDVGEQEGSDYLVMEYIEGETLAEKLTRGALPLNQVLRYGRQIADALDRAHRQGIVHRDLKPGNVIITKNGSVKLLDFGLAKENVAILTSPSVRGEKKADSDDRTVRRGAESERPLTAEGMIVGTLPYMAPEQIEGKEIDARTDIFAFGTMLYEMVTGKRAFEGKTRASLIVAIIDHDPVPIMTLQPGQSPALDHVISKCLKKDPDSRWQSARDIGTELQWIEEGGQIAIGQGVSTTTRRFSSYAALAFLLLSIILGSLAWWNYREAHRAGQNRKLSIELAADAPLFTEIAVNNFSLAPDGKTLVYVGLRGGKTSLFLRRLDDEEVVPLAGTAGAEGPFFSPDGKSIGFAAEKTLKRIEVSGGGSPITICDASLVRGASWGSDGTIVFGAMDPKRLMRVSASGGAPEAVTAARSGESDRYPQFLPDGEHVLFTTRRDDLKEHSLAAVSLRTKKITQLLPRAFGGKYEKGRLFYGTPSGLFSVPFDPGELRVRGAATPVSSEVSTFLFAGIAFFAVSADGSLIFLPRDKSSEERELVVVDAKGVVTALTKTRVNYDRPTVSPDGQEIVFDVFESIPGSIRSDIWRYRIATGSSSRLTSNGMSNGATWSPDQTMLAYVCLGRDRKGDTTNRDVCVMSANGGNPIRVLAHEMEWAWPGVYGWSKDGRFIVFARHDVASSWDILKWDLSKGDTEKAILPLVLSGAIEGGASLSADSRWLAYHSNESGRFEIYVTTFPDATRRWQVTTEGGYAPVWAFDSRRIFYRQDDRVMVVDVTTAPEPVFSEPRLFYGGEDLRPGQMGVLPDGRLIGVRSLTQPAPPTRLSIEENFLSRLPRE